MRQDDSADLQEQRDFFISYTGSDRQWAEWIAMQLDQAGRTFFIQAWDFRPGSNFVAEMDRAAKCSERTLLVLSPAYLQSEYAFSEWAAAFRRDPKGTHRRLLPVRIQPVEVEGLLGPIVFIDLVSLDETQARERLLAGIQQGRVRPASVAFPGQRLPTTSSAYVAFPGTDPLPWNVPFARNPFFTGRDELLEHLHAHLQTALTAALSQPQAISGLGGIGKTQLAIEYAYRYRQEYQAVLWARADTLEALNASYTEIARLLQLREQDEQKQDVIVQAVKNWLRSRGDWLLILDNAGDLALVQPFVPTPSPGHLLLTTRAQTLGKFAQRLEVETLEQDVGALLLLRRAGLLAPDAPLATALPADRAIANTLTEELGGLPLALDQAGAYIEETQCSLADYRQQYQTRRAALLALRGGLQDDHPEPVATTWSLSFAKVEAANPLAAAVLRICAFLAPDAIPEKLLVEALKTPLPASDASKKQLPQAGQGINEVVGILRAYSLIRRNTQTKTCSVHRLVQAVLRETLAEREQRQWIEQARRVVAAILPAVSHEQWPQWEQVLPHAQVCIQQFTDKGRQGREVTRLLYLTGWYLTERGRYREAEPLVERAYQISLQEQGSDHLDTARDANTLAYLYQAQGRYGEAEPLYVRVLAMREEELGATHPATAQSLNNLAGLYDSQGKYEEAQVFFQRALTIREEVLGAEHPNTINTLWWLAIVSKHQQHSEEALSWYERALSASEQAGRSEHPDTQSIREAYAALLERLKKEEGAQ